MLSDTFNQRCRRPWNGLGGASLLGALCLLFCLFSTPIFGATYLVTNDLDNGLGSLRAAMDSADANPGADSIHFDFGGSDLTIELITPLDTVYETVIIDGTTEPNYVAGGLPGFFITGQSAANESGFVFWGAGAAGSKLLGAGMMHINNYAVEIRLTSNISIASCWMGLETNGATSASIGKECVFMLDSDSILIGGPSATDRNVITNSATHGVYGYRTDNVDVDGNIIGLAIDGLSQAANLGNGISFDDCVGGAIRRNVVSQNNDHGMQLIRDTSFVVHNNFIGIDQSGVIARANQNGGVQIHTCADITVNNNTISGNGGSGIWCMNNSHNIDLLGNIIGLDAFNNNEVPNDDHGVGISGCVDVVIASSTISGNNLDGVYVFNGSDSVTINNNNIGFDGSGFVDRGNNQDGISLDNSTNIGVVANNIGNNGSNGITLDSDADNCVIENNHIGMDASGFNTAGNNQSGIMCTNSDDLSVLFNLISGNGTHGIQLGSGSDDFIVGGNTIGLIDDQLGVAANTFNGVYILSGSSHGRVGLNLTGYGNVISGQGQNGVIISDDCIGTEVVNNLIGLNGIETAGLGNTGLGILLQNRCDSTLIQNNVIASNTGGGIFAQSDCEDIEILDNHVGLASVGTLPLGNGAHGIHVFQRCRRALIDGNIASNNVGNGIYVEDDCDDVVITSNIVGLNNEGDAAMPNTGVGIELRHQCDGVLIGLPGQGNVVSGNDFDGIYLHENCTNDTIRGNYVGLSASGRQAIGNGKHGIFLQQNTNYCVVGGTNAEANYVAANTNNGISLTFAHNNEITGNYIGTDIYAVKKLGNGEDGINLYNSNNNFIGGAFEYKNYIGNNLRDGITLEEYSDDNTVQGNWIGLAPDGKTNFGNGLNLGSCLDIKNGSRILVGGCGPGEGNVMMNSITSGAGIYTEHIYDCSILGNFIGTDTSQTIIGGNTYRGISMYGTSAQHFWGTGADESCGNVLAHNLSDAIYMDVNTVDQVQARNNSFYGNQGIGINLNGAANQNRGAPVITSLSNCFIDGTSPFATDTIDIYYDWAYNSQFQGAEKIATVVTSAGSWSYSGTIEGGSRIVVMGTNSNERSSHFVDFGSQDLTDAGRDSTVYFCVSEPVIDLFDQLAGTYDAGGTWLDDDVSGALVGSQFFPNTVTAGTYRFTHQVPISGGCGGNDEATVTVVVSDQPEAGTGATLYACESGDPINLMDSLTGNSTNEGTWVDLDNAYNADSIFYPVDLDGDYEILFVTDPQGCLPDTAFFSVNVSDNADAGIFGTGIVCASSGPVDLFDYLNGTPDLNGTWVDSSATGELSGSTFDPTNLSAGEYRFGYVIGSIGSCVSDTASVRLTVELDPVVGSDLTFELCEDFGWFQLSDSLIAGTTSGGTWASADAPGALSGDSVNISALTPGLPNYFNFEYTTPSNNCGQSSVNFAISATPSANAGRDTTIELCNSNAAFDVAALVETGADAGGTYLDLDGAGSLTGSMFDPNAVAAGDYDIGYATTTGPACPNDTAVFTITVNDSLVPGVLTTIDICSTSSDFDLMDSLDGSPDLGGTWSIITGGTAAPGDVFDVSASGQGNHVLRYILPANGACPADSAQLEVNVELAPDAGRDSAVTLCVADGTYDLNDALTGQAGVGTWLDLNASGALVGSDIDLNGLNGDYLFGHELTGTNCQPDTAFVTITVEDTVYAGISTVISMCSSQSDFALIDSLAGTPQSGGVWTLIAGSATIVNDSLDVSASMGVSQVQYRVAGGVACPADSTTIDITVEFAEEAGNDSSSTICASETAFDVATLLQGNTSTGTWADMDGAGALVGSVLDATGLSGTFRFTHVLIGTDCPNDTAWITLSIQSLNAGGKDSSMTFCESVTGLNLNDHLASDAMTNGYWVDKDVTGALISSVLDYTAVGDSVTFWYVDSASTACVSDTALYTLLKEAAPDPGLDLDTAVCLGSPGFDLDSILLLPLGVGTWQDHNDSGYLSGSILDLSEAVEENLTYHYVVEGNVCPDDSAAYGVQIQSGLEAGLDNNATFCNADGIVNLETLLVGEDAINNWRDLDADTAIAALLDVTGLDGIYSFGHVIDAVGSCAADTAVLTLSISDFETTVSTTYDGICQGGVVDLNDFLNAQSQGQGIWQDTTGSMIPGGQLDTDAETPGIYKAVYMVSGVGSCATTFDTLVIEIFDATPVTEDSLLMFCQGAVVEDMNAIMGFNGGDWLDSVDNVVSPIVDLSGLTGDFTFTHINTEAYNCATDSAYLTFEIRSAAPVAQDSAITLLFDGVQLDLSDLFAPLADRAEWVDSDNSGGLTGSDFDPTVVADGQHYDVHYVLVNGCGVDSGLVDIYVTMDCGPSAYAITEPVCQIDGSVALMGYIPADMSAVGEWFDMADTTAIANDTLDLSAQLGTYQLWFITDSMDECASDTLTLSLFVGFGPDAGEDIDTALCNDGAEVILDQLLVGASTTNGTWIGASPPHNTISDTVDLGNLAAINELLYVVADGCDSDTAQLLLQALPVPSAEAGEDFTMNRGTVDSLNAVVAGEDLFGWLGDPTLDDSTLVQPHITPISTTTYYLVAATLEGCSATDSVTVMVENILEIPQAFTPDADGKNDTWEIRNIDLFANNHVQIYDRWGALMYESSGYSTPWDGTFKDKQVPIGAYVYIVNLGDGGTPISGTLNLIR